jgi:hypothetical protein
MTHSGRTHDAIRVISVPAHLAQRADAAILVHLHLVELLALGRRAAAVEERQRRRGQPVKPQREQQPRRRLETSLSSMASQFLLDAFEKANQGAADAATRNASFDYFGVP